MTAGRVTNAELSVKLDDIKGKVDAMHECIYGNGDPRQGMATRLSLVEQFQGDIKGLMWIAVGAATTSAIGLIISLIVNG